MGLINIPAIENLDEANEELWNSRYALIAKVLNGNVDTDNLKDGSVTAPKIAASSITYGKLANPIQFFSATKTSDQYAEVRTPVGVSTPDAVITFQQKDEFLGANNFDTATSEFVAPANGWLDYSVTLIISGGDHHDDTMKWGIVLNDSASWTRAYNDNWRYWSAPARESIRTVTAGIQLATGDKVKIMYGGLNTGDHANIQIQRESSFTGRFFTA
jgi:hypothetical protein